MHSPTLSTSPQPLDLPLVSVVVVCTHATDNACTASVGSVLLQSYPHIELILAHLAVGGEASAPMPVDDPRVRWMAQPGRSVVGTMNAAVRSARGTFVAVVQAGDVYRADAIHDAMQTLLRTPDLLAVCGTEAACWDGLLDEAVGGPQGAGLSALLFRRTLLLLLGPLDEGLASAYGLDLALRMLKAVPDRVGYVRPLLSQPPQQAGGLLQGGHALQAWLAECTQVLARHPGMAAAQWVRGYARLLLAQPSLLPAGENLLQHLMALIDAGQAWLGPADQEAMRTWVDGHEEIARASTRTPKANYDLALQEFRNGVTKVQSTPHLLTLETTSRCNLRCVMCPHAIGAVTRPKHLEESLVEELGRFVQQATSIQLHGIGEPLNSPAFWSTLQHLPDQAVCESSINTNLTVLDDKRLQRLLDSNLRIINVSLDAATAGTYWRIRGFDFDTVLGNLRRLVAARNERGARFPLVYLNMTLMRTNIEEVPALVQLAHDMGVDVVCLWHLNRWSDAEMARYVVQRDDWVFDYKAEGLWNFPELSNDYLRQAQALGKKLGVQLYLDHNKSVFFDEPQEQLHGNG